MLHQISHIIVLLIAENVRNRNVNNSKYSRFEHGKCKSINAIYIESIGGIREDWESVRE